MNPSIAAHIHALLVMVDVVGLYLNIPQRDGINRVLAYRYKKIPEESVPIDHFRAFMYTILTHIYSIFHFAGRMFRQTKGTTNTLIIALISVITDHKKPFSFLNIVCVVQTCSYILTYPLALAFTVQAVMDEFIPVGTISNT